MVQLGSATLPLVSVTIPTRNRPKIVVETVRSVFAGQYQHFELIVVDQSADEATQQALTPWEADPRFHYHRNRRATKGAASSRNIGIALSSGEIVAIIDDDVTVCPNWMSNMVAELTADPRLQFICGKLTAPPYDERTGFIPAFDPAQIIPPLTNWTMPMHAAGANFGMRRTLFDQVGGYDECFGPGRDLISDDCDIAFRIMRSGAKWKACPEVEVVHTYGFRDNVAARELLKQYMRGNGGLYGRVTRRGDLIAGLWFLRQQAYAVLRVLLSHGLRRGRPAGMGWVRDGAIGFLRGFRLPPGQGLVGMEDLRLLREQLLDASAEAGNANLRRHP